jgi:hypothetical protein
MGVERAASKRIRPADWPHTPDGSVNKEQGARYGAGPHGEQWIGKSSDLEREAAPAADERGLASQRYVVQAP